MAQVQRSRNEIEVDEADLVDLVPSFADQFALSGVELADMGLGWSLESVR